MAGPDSGHAAHHHGLWVAWEKQLLVDLAVVPIAAASGLPWRNGYWWLDACGQSKHGVVGQPEAQWDAASCCFFPQQH